MEKTPDRPSKVRHKSVMVTTKSNNVVLQQLFFLQCLYFVVVSLLYSRSLSYLGQRMIMEHYNLITFLKPTPANLF